MKFKQGVTTGGQQRALQSLRSRPSITQFKWIGDAALLTDPTESDATNLAARLSSQSEVAYAEPNYLYKKQQTTPHDPGFVNNQWNFRAIDLPRAWDLNGGGSNKVVVAVVDSGISTVNQKFVFPTWNGLAIQNIIVPFRVNPDLGASRLISPRDFVTAGGSTVLDMGGHGTHVSATIGEDTNNAFARGWHPRFRTTRLG